MRSDYSRLIHGKERDIYEKVLVRYRGYGMYNGRATGIFHKAQVRVIEKALTGYICRPYIGTS